jgi:hypothetical protein
LPFNAQTHVVELTHEISHQVVGAGNLGKHWVLPCRLEHRWKSLRLQGSIYVLRAFLCQSALRWLIRFCLILYLF